MSLPLIISVGDPGHISHHEQIHQLLGGSGAPWVARRDLANQFTAVNQFTSNTFFAAAAPWVDPRHSDYGAAGDGVADDTTEVQAALDGAGALAITHTPAGGSQTASVALLYLGTAHYRLTAPIVFTAAGLSYVAIGSDGRGIVRQATAGQNTFDMRGIIRVELEGVIFSGGKTQVLYGNNNIDASQVFVTRCEFHNSTDWSIDTTLTGTWGTVSNLSANLVIEKCKFMNGNRYVRNVAGLRVVIKDSWVHLEGTTMVHGAVFENHNEMVFDGMYGTPPTASTPTDAHWIDNYGQFHADHSRFGGENAGMSVVWNYAGPQVVDPYNLGGVVNIRNSYLSSGPDAGRLQAIVNMVTAVPQAIVLEGNYGIAQSSNPWIVDNIAGGAAAYIAANFTGNVYGYVWIPPNNIGHQPFDSTKMPVSMTTSERIIVNGRKITTVASAASITLPVGSGWSEYFHITGTTNIDTIVATGHNGRVITLTFAGVLTVGDGTGNLKLAGNFTTSSDDALTLICNGTVWAELSRSVN